MAELRDLLHRAAPPAPDFDEPALLRLVARRNHRRRATLAASVVVLVAVIAVAIGVNDRSDRRTIIVSPSPTAPSTTRTSGPAVAGDVQWRALPPAPIGARAGAASVWTGSAFVVWGGRDASYRALSDGAWYDPRTQVWHPMHASPLAPPGPSGVYRGMPLAGDAVIVSGRKAAVYTPGTDSWRALPDVPLAKVDGSALTMPGAPEMVVVNGVDRGGRGALAWLDKVEGSWHTVAMQGRAGVVLLANGHVVYWPDNVGVDTDLATGAERRIPKIPAALLHGYPFEPGLVAGPLVISPLAQLAWDATTGAYEAIPSGQCGAAHAWTGRVLLTWGGSECQGDGYSEAGAEYDPSSGALRPLPKFLSGRSGMAFAWTGTELLIWGGQRHDSTGPVVADGASLTVGTTAEPTPATVVVPSVVGNELTTATNWVQAVGLRVSVGHGPRPTGSSVVVAQDPPPGSRVLRGTSVTLTVAP
jgi:hypothetical protein